MKISIITVSFNAEKTIEKTIKSVINSKTPNCEYIIIDGGSSDNTCSIIEKYKEYIDYYISEPDNGMYHAIQKGFDKSQGDVLCWLNADDMFLPWTLKVVEEVFTKFEDVDWITGLPGFYNDNDIYTSIRSKPAAYIQYLMKKGWYSENLLGNIQQESSFWRRELYKKSGGLDFNLKFAADFKLWKEFAKYSKLYNVNIPLSGFRKDLEGQQLSIKNKPIYRSEVNEASNFGILAKLFIFFNSKSVIFQSLFKLSFIWKSGVIAFSESENSWKKINVLLSASRVDISALVIEYFLRKK